MVGFTIISEPEKNMLLGYNFLSRLEIWEERKYILEVKISYGVNLFLSTGIPACINS